jgi:PAS domain S-box-containing protein
LKEPLSPAQRERVELIQRSALRLNKLVNSLLDFARIEAGRIETIYEPVDLATFTAELASVFQSAIERAGLQLKIECAEIGEPVYIDREMWEKIVLNLISNALKFTFAGEISVSVRRAEGQAIVSISDSGIGIPADELPNLFKRFHRIRGAQARTHEGSGIGLALTKQLVNLHSGTITVASTVGQGTTFTTSIPLGTAHLPPDRLVGERKLASTATSGRAYVEEALRWFTGKDGDNAASLRAVQAPETLSRSSSSSAGVLDSQGARVLLVDDNADMREYLRGLLEPQWKVHAVPDGEAALSSIPEFAPELILTNVMMPKVDGFELLRRIRQDQKTHELPVILLSARAGEESIEGLKAGADDYLIKPFSARELIARVDAHIRLKRLRDHVATAQMEARRAIEESEERFRKLADKIPQLAWMAKPDGWRFWYNQRWYDYTGEKPEKMEGWGWRSVHHPEHVDRVVASYTRAIESGEPWEDTFPLRSQDGEYRWFLSRALPLRDAQGRIDLWFGTNTEVTEQRDAAEILRQSDRHKDEFLAMLGHELRNPLAPISNALHVLELDGDIKRSEWAHNIIKRQSDHLIRLVDDLLDVSRISQGKITLRRQPVALDEIVRQAVETISPSIDAKRQQLSIMMTKDRLWLDGDSTRLVQIFSNLLNNSSKFTPG